MEFPDQCPQIEACFRVIGENLNPDEISSKLALSPSHSHRRGDPRYGSQGRRYSDYSEGAWMLQASVGASDLIQVHLKDILDKLTGRTTMIKEILSLGLRGDILVGVFGMPGNFNFSLDPTISHALSELGLTIQFDLYSAES